MKWLAVLLLAGCPLLGADREFDGLVKAVESHYGVRPTHIPLMKLANLVVKVARPAGTSGFRLALFENIASSPGYGDVSDLEHFFDSLPAGGLRPLVRAHSQRNGESTYICAGESGKSTRLLIATFERNEATVIEVKVNAETLMKVIGNPQGAGSLFGGKGDRESW